MNLNFVRKSFPMLIKWKQYSSTTITYIKVLSFIYFLSKIYEAWCGPNSIYTGILDKRREKTVNGLPLYKCDKVFTEFQDCHNGNGKIFKLLIEVKILIQTSICTQWIFRTGLRGNKSKIHWTCGGVC